MPRGDSILRYWLAKLKEAKQEGMAQDAAVRAADKATEAKYGRLPKESS